MSPQPIRVKQSVELPRGLAKWSQQTRHLNDLRKQRRLTTDMDGLASNDVSAARARGRGHNAPPGSTRMHSRAGSPREKCLAGSSAPHNRYWLWLQPIV